MTDKIFQKRKIATRRKDLERRRATKNERKRVLIICEGEKTEPLYFRRLISSFGLSTADIRICGKECGSDPLSVVKYGESCLNNDNDFDFMSLVFDRDAHQTYGRALEKIKCLKGKHKFRRTSINAITSNPCFEFWFLMHLTVSSKPYSVIGCKSSADCLIDDLMKYKIFENYSKSVCNYFDEIIDKIEDAIVNSKRLLEGREEEAKNKHYLNPSTFVHELVKILQEISSEQSSQK